MKKIAGIVISLICTYIPDVNAATKQKLINYSIGLGTPITTTSTDTMGKGEWGVSERIEYYPNKPLSDLVLLQNPASESQNFSLTNYFMAFYGLSNNITIGASLPYTYTSNLRAADLNEELVNSNVSNLGNISGIGDVNLFASRLLFDEGKYPISMAVFVGLDTPTGKTSVVDNQNMLFSASDQPGRGSWSPTGGLVFTKKWDKVALSSNLIYTQTTPGAQDTTLGSLFDYNFAAVIALYNNKSSFSMDGVLELNGEYAAEDKIAGIDDPNSGGNSLFALAGFRVNVKQSVSLYLGIERPIIEKYNGTQVKTQYGAIGGIDFST